MAPGAAAALLFCLYRTFLSLLINTHCVKFKWLLINGSLQAAECSFYNELWACKLFKVEYG